MKGRPGGSSVGALCSRYSGMPIDQLFAGGRGALTSGCSPPVRPGLAGGLHLHPLAGSRPGERRNRVFKHRRAVRPAR